MSSSVSAQSLLTKDKAFFATESKEQLLEQLLSMIEYAKTFEASTRQPSITGKKRKLSDVESAPVDISGTVEKLRSVIEKQIKMQMVWKTGCKDHSAKWNYQGLCNYEVFKALVGFEPELKPRCKKFSKIVSLDEFEKNILGKFVTKDIRYRMLSLSGNVTISWNKDTSEFGFSGCYGI